MEDHKISPKFNRHLPERVIPEPAGQDEPAVDGDDEAGVAHVHLLAEVVPEVTAHLVAGGVRHHGQDRVHGQRERGGAGARRLRLGVARALRGS